MHIYRVVSFDPNYSPCGDLFSLNLYLNTGVLVSPINILFNSILQYLLDF